MFGATPQANNIRISGDNTQQQHFLKTPDNSDMQLSRESLVKGQRIGLKTWAWSFTVDVHSVRGSTLTETAHPPGTMVTISMSCFTTGGPGKEH